MTVRPLPVLLPLLLAACAGPQSALDPAGRDAEEILDLFWILAGGAAVIWVMLNSLFVYTTRIDNRPLSRRLAETLIIGGGVIFPTIVLGALLAYALPMMPAQRAPGDGLAVRVTGEQWWWRVEYLPPGGGPPIVAANEVRLPVGARTDILLGADKVIHSFWIPSLGGKMDMFPGRPTRMALEPTRAGVFRGQCAEFCGESHALMAFQAVTMPPEDFAAWLDREAGPAAPPEGPAAERGLEIFLREGCGACHAVRGTPARGRVGPDLTHLGGRTTLAAGTLPATHAALVDWVRDAPAIKPGAQMPPYRHLGEAELDDLATYLTGLR